MLGCSVGPILFMVPPSINPSQQCALSTQSKRSCLGLPALVFCPELPITAASSAPLCFLPCSVQQPTRAQASLDNNNRKSSSSSHPRSPDFTPKKLSRYHALSHTSSEQAYRPTACSVSVLHGFLICRRCQFDVLRTTTAFRIKGQPP